MEDYILSCSSTADMTNGYYSSRDIHHIDSTYSIDGQIYDESMGESVPLSDFYEKMRNGINPTTSQIDMADYKEYFKKFLEDGKDILHICLSSSISDSYLTATAAAEELKGEYPERQLHVVDSLSASAGMGLLIDILADKRDEGMPIDRLKLYAENSKKYINHWFFSTDLTTYLKEESLTNFTYKIGKTLNFCPLMCVNGDGKLVVIEKVKTKKKTMEAIVSRMEVQAVDGKRYTGKCFISHADSEKEATKLASMLEARFPNLKGNVEVKEIGHIIGAHTGPGTVAVFFVGDKR
ncbi:MAG: DegV family protein [Lachnoanaerobaculum sp.]|nr:DegV family protein [Lachnoanaerobaculum sp.]